MYKSRKVTRNNINKENMVALGYCQCQHTLNFFAEDFKVGYNSGISGWNYDLYNINGTSLAAGYNVPYAQYSDKTKKEKLIALENKVSKCSLKEYRENRERWRKEFLEIFSN